MTEFGQTAWLIELRPLQLQLADPFSRFVDVADGYLGAVPGQRGDSHLEGGYPGHRAAALFREAWDVTRPRRVEKREHQGPRP